MCEKECCCRKPEHLKGKPGECSPERIRECHGDEKPHPCTCDEDEKPLS
ncbi:hypothetical protein [Aminiphilus sp.]|jgi:hypothetical protein|nr:hypothetical protein [Aminiphilus sp.]